MVLELIRRVRDKGLPVILISHNMPHVFEMSDRIHIQRLGKRAAVVNPREISMSDAVAIMTGALQVNARTLRCARHRPGIRTQHDACRYRRRDSPGAARLRAGGAHRRHRQGLGSRAAPHGRIEPGGDAPVQRAHRPAGDPAARAAAQGRRCPADAAELADCVGHHQRSARRRPGGQAGPAAGPRGTALRADRPEPRRRVHAGNQGRDAAAWTCWRWISSARSAAASRSNTATPIPSRSFPRFRKVRAGGEAAWCACRAHRRCRRRRAAVARRLAGFPGGAGRRDGRVERDRHPGAHPDADAAAGRVRQGHDRGVRGGAGVRPGPQHRELPVPVHRHFRRRRAGDRRPSPSGSPRQRRRGRLGALARCLAARPEATAARRVGTGARAVVQAAGACRPRPRTTPGRSRPSCGR